MRTRRVLVVVGIFATLGVAGYIAYRSPWVRNWFARDSENAAEIAKIANKKLELEPVADSGVGWPQWRGPTRDGRAPAGHFRTDWDANPPKLLWKAPVGGGYGSCAMVGGRLYVQNRKDGRDILLCLDAATGDMKWEVGNGANYEGTDPQYAIGPRSTPIVEGKLIWTVDGAGQLRCFRSREPEGQGVDEVWHVDLMTQYDAKVPKWGVACSPLLEGDLLIVQPGGKRGAVVALDKQTGETRWTAGDNPPSYSSPSVGTIEGQRVVFAFMGDALLAIRARDGKVTGSYRWKTMPEVNVVTPLVVEDYVFISSAYGMGCALLRGEARGDGVELVEVYARRRPPGMQNHHSSSVFKDKYLFGFDGDRLKCVEFANGHENKEWDSAGVGKGSLILAGKHLIIQTERGELCLVEANHEAFQLVKKIPGVLSGRNNWATPTLVDGRLYLRDEEKVVCYDLR